MKMGKRKTAREGSDDGSKMEMEEREKEEKERKRKRAKTEWKERGGGRRENRKNGRTGGRLN